MNDRTVKPFDGSPNMNRISAVFLTLLLAVPAVSATASAIDESRPAQPDVHVRIENVVGRVAIEVGDEERVELTGSLGSGNKLQFDGDRKRLSIKVEPEDGGGWGRRGSAGAAELLVRVPRGARIEVKTVSAKVELDGVAGSQAEIETVSGSIRYQGDAERVHLKSVSGSIDGAGAGRIWTVGSVSGRIRLPQSAGELRLETVSGSVEFNFSRASRVRAETVSGRIVATGALDEGGEVAMQSVSGAIELNLTGAVDAHIQGKTFSGAIRSAFGTPQRSGIGGGHQLDERVGSGRGEIRLESFSGRITIQHAP